MKKHIVSVNGAPYGRLFIGEYYVPWQEFINTVGRPFRPYAQDMVQICFRIDTVQTAGTDQTVQQCATLAAVIAAEEHVDDMTFIYSL